MGAFAFLTSVYNVLYFTIVVDGTRKLEMYGSYENTNCSFIIVNIIRKIENMYSIHFITDCLFNKDTFKSGFLKAYCHGGYN